MRFGIHYRLWSRAWSDADLDLIPRARDLGYSAFEITVSNLAQINANAIRQRAEAAGMEIVATLSLAKDRALATPDPAVRRQGIAFLGAAVERVREMNCCLLVGMLYGTPGLFTGKGPTADELRWAAEGLRQTAEFAKACGMTLALEPVNRYETYLLKEIQYAGIVSIECFSFVSPEVPAITPVWRTLFPSPDELARSGLAFLSEGLGGLR
jgi:D-psicose/D-tagatose/L-ribulose 3-epimerase